jgi:UDP-galactopyranose mutase
LCLDYAAALARWQRELPKPSAEGSPMTPVIVFSHLRWEFVYQRPQQLMSRLAEQFRVLFVEEPVCSEGPARLVCVPQGPNLDVLVPHTPLSAPGFHDDQLPLLRPLLDAYVHEQGLQECVAWFYTPMALPLISQMRPRMVVYDCMDELSAFKDAPRQLRQRETALLKVADLVLTGGPSLYEAKRKLHPNVHYLPSAVDAARFAPREGDQLDLQASQAARLLESVPRPRLGYFGVIDERLDLSLLEALANARPAWHLVMVGPVVKIDPGSVPQRPNIHWLGLQPYAHLPHLLARWDVCLMPFAINEATRFISPTKTLEYLAGEKPVVSTPVSDVVSLYGDVVRIARSTTEFIDACAALLAETAWQRGQRLGRVVTTVHRMSWTQHAQQVGTLLKAHLGQTLTRRASQDHGPPKRAPRTRAAATPVPRALREVRHLVIGAGPTGLAAALHLGEGAVRGDTLLIEREHRVGGWCRSVQQQGYTFDHAGHILFSTDPTVLKLCDRLLAGNLHWQNREAWIYSKNVYTRYPFQGSLYGLPPQVLKECLVGAIEARFGPLRGPGVATTVSPPANFEEFIQRVWGRGVGEHFAVPYNRKLWTVPLSEMDTSWLGGRVPVPDLEQMIAGALQPTPPPMGATARFGYPLHGGFQALMDAFMPLLNCELELGIGVLQVSPSRRTVRLDDGRIVGFRSLISTMSLPRLVEACGDEAPAAVRAAARGLRHVSVRCVNLGVGLPPGQQRLSDKHWVYYPEDAVFHRIFLQGNASPHNSPPGGFGLSCEITYSASKPLPCDGAPLVERVVADCRRVGMIGDANPVQFASQLDMPCAYVVYDHARPAHLATIRRWLRGSSIVLAGRYAEWEYYNSDHAFLAGRRAAEQARRELPLAALAEAS